jgi:hypothetical protein
MKEEFIAAGRKLLNERIYNLIFCNHYCKMMKCGITSVVHIENSAGIINNSQIWPRLPHRPYNVSFDPIFHIVL